jgi:asparagine synthase (glutamine-hydrolysing)
MFRYIALVWNPADTPQTEASATITERLGYLAPEFKSCFDFRGLRVLCAESGTPGLKVHNLHDNAGVLLGAVFKRHADVTNDLAASEPTFDSVETTNLVSNGGRRLVAGYWGDYVAFLIDRPSGTKRIIKDPTGNLPCFSTSWRRVIVVFSCLSDCVALNLFRFTVNWSYVVSRVGSGGCASRSNPLNEVSQVHRGECLEISANDTGRQTRTLFWIPTAFSQPSCTIDDTDLAARALRSTVRSATRTFAKSQESVLLRLSGGLDSSVISGCLRGAHERLTVRSYTYFVSGGRSDERRWARLAADFAGSTHLEFAVDPARTRLDAMSRLRPTVTPIWAYSYLVGGELERKIAEEHPYSTVFNGDGGDSGFGAESISLATDDFVRLRGFSRGLITLASQVALRTHAMTWSVLGATLHRRLFGTSMTDYRDRFLRTCALVSSEVRGAGLQSEQYPHPWFDSCEDVPWHSIRRLGNLTQTPQLYDPFLPPTSFSPYVAAPLYSQPVVELCLRIPVYIHFHQGRDRGLAREAFREDVPSQILRRQWKDRAPGAFENLVRRNRPFLREMLLGGILSNEGLLDQNALQDALNDKLSSRPFFVGELLSHLDLELWLRHFVGNQAQRQAARALMAV